MRENVFICDLCHARVKETRWEHRAVGLYLNVYLPSGNPMGAVSTNGNWQSSVIEYKEVCNDCREAVAEHIAAAVKSRLVLAERDAQQVEIKRLHGQLRLAQREAAPAVQVEPVAYIRQEDFEFILADDKSEPYGTRQAPVFSRKDCRAPVPLYASPQPPAQDVSALVEALEDIRSRSSIDLAMNPNPFTLTAMLGNIHQIADAALSKGNSND